MAKLSKRIGLIKEAVRSKAPAGGLWSPEAAFGLLRELSVVKFEEQVEVSVSLGVDPKKTDQLVRGSVLLPHGTGKTVRVCVIAQGMVAEAAKAAGADLVGFEAVVADIKDGKMDFDVLIATPDTMAVVGQLGSILGPRGLMPNPKVGTVTQDVARAVKNFKQGQVQYKTDKGGIIHCRIGNVKFEVGALVDNLKGLVGELLRVKPSTSKGVYLKKVVVKSTMGPGLAIDLKSVTSV